MDFILFLSRLIENTSRKATYNSYMEKSRCPIKVSQLEPEP